MRDTELSLVTWRNGSIQAERLAAAALNLSGFEEIDPQGTLGGPDGAKDILCAKGGVTWVVAVYFPSTPIRFSSVKKKFVHDLTNAPAGHGGFAFVTNQPLTVGQRGILEATATTAGKAVDIFHLERLRALLDSPMGYGVRLQFLQITMTGEEQLAWFEESGSRVAQALTVNTRELIAIKAMVQRLTADSAEIVRTMSQLGAAGITTPDLLSTTNFVRSDNYEAISARLDPSAVLLFHRLTCFDLPTRTLARFRKLDVWLGTSEGERRQVVQPPPAADVPDQLQRLCSAWRQGFVTLAKADFEERLLGVARFHSALLVIHPFLDGNGRMARAILMQQCLDLFGHANLSLLQQGVTYYRALAAADNGNAGPLVDLLRPVAQG